MKYIDADKIKAEIERLRHEWPPTFTEGEKQHLHASKRKVRGKAGLTMD